VLTRWREHGPRKLREAYLAKLDEVVRGRPSNYGYSRPTWVCEWLLAVMHRLTSVQVCVGTMSRAPKMIGARRGHPRPTVACPWPEDRRNGRLLALGRLAENPAAGEVVVYADEVDIALNPKIGLDWVGLGQQKQVVTPGQSAQRYLPGPWTPGPAS
jgi:hypothetical protein